MALTHHPFNTAPAINHLAQDLRMNVSDPERIASGALGVALVGAAASRTGILRWAFLLAGAALIGRGVTGRCPGYGRAKVDRRHEASGVPGNRGTKVEHSIEIHRSPDVLYSWWRDLENLPHAMTHVLNVRQLSARRSHWQVRAPFGQIIDWYAEIIAEEPGAFISWQSLPGAAVRSAGSVHFEPNGAGGTHLRVVFTFDPPAGALGAAVASVFGPSPEQELVEDLARFKEFAERELQPFASGVA